MVDPVESSILKCGFNPKHSTAFSHMLAGHCQSDSSLQWWSIHRGSKGTNWYSSPHLRQHSLGLIKGEGGRNGSGGGGGYSTK